MKYRQRALPVCTNGKQGGRPALPVFCPLELRHVGVDGRSAPGPKLARRLVAQFIGCPSTAFMVDIISGGSKTVTFTAPSTAGTYEIDCTVTGHKDLGMTGTLKVMQW